MQILVTIGSGFLGGWGGVGQIYHFPLICIVILKTSGTTGQHVL